MPCMPSPLTTRPPMASGAKVRRMPSAAAPDGRISAKASLRADRDEIGSLGNPIQLWVN